MEDGRQSNLFASVRLVAQPDFIHKIEQSANCARSQWDSQEASQEGDWTHQTKTKALPSCSLNYRMDEPKQGEQDACDNNHAEKLVHEMRRQGPPDDQSENSQPEGHEDGCKEPQELVGDQIIK